MCEEAIPQSDDRDVGSVARQGEQAGEGGSLGAGQDRSRHFISDWLLVTAAAFSLYTLTANRGAQWQDCGLFILNIVQGELVNPLGLALTHPLHYWLGRLAIWPGVLEPSFAITLVSSLGAAAA